MFRRNGALSGVCFCAVTAGAAASLTREINKDRERVHVCVCVRVCMYVCVKKCGRFSEECCVVLTD